MINPHVDSYHYCCEIERTLMESSINDIQKISHTLAFALAYDDIIYGERFGLKSTPYRRYYNLAVDELNGDNSLKVKFDEKETGGDVDEVKINYVVYICYRIRNDDY